MTYEEVLQKYPDEHEQRYEDKFKYRSPRGEVRREFKLVFDGRLVCLFVYLSLAWLIVCLFVRWLFVCLFVKFACLLLCFFASLLLCFFARLLVFLFVCLLVCLCASVCYVLLCQLLLKK
jgi:hypothetical protein